ncbi:nitroreductase/quinone reductase family protein, partial [Nocardia gipuzkoensis]
MCLTKRDSGSDRNPAWYHNLVANPELAVEVGADSYRAEARPSEGEERTRLFARPYPSNRVSPSSRPRHGDGSRCCGSPESVDSWPGRGASGERRSPSKAVGLQGLPTHSHVDERTIRRWVRYRFAGRSEGGRRLNQSTAMEDFAVRHGHRNCDRHERPDRLWHRAATSVRCAVHIDCDGARVTH